MIGDHAAQVKLSYELGHGDNFVPFVLSRQLRQDCAGFR